jgi:hypothetical protein
LIHFVPSFGVAFGNLSPFGRLWLIPLDSGFTGCDAGAFVARMWLSKSKLPQASLRPFHFLTANPGKP